MYHPWSEHNKALSNPHYRMEGLMDCFREEVSFSMPYRPAETLPPSQKQLESQWTKRQWGRIQQLEADNKHLRQQWYEHLKEDREYRANASKKKTNSNIYNNVTLEEELNE